MATRRPRTDVEVESIRHIVAGLTHDEVLMNHRALMAYAAMLTEVDKSLPNPEQRTMASQATHLAARFQRANMTRDYLESKGWDQP